MSSVGKKEFERLYTGGVVEQVCRNNYALINNEENLYILFDLSNYEVIENSHTNLTEKQINKLMDLALDFKEDQIDRDYWEDEPMDAFEEYNTFY